MGLIATAAWALVLALVSTTRAQDAPAVQAPVQRVADEPRNLVREAWTIGSIVPPADASQPPQVPAITGLDLSGSFLDIVYDSLFGDAYSEAAQAAWRPLRLGTFFTDGWNEPYIEPPAGRGGAPRSGWVNSFEGTFFRSWFLSFSFANEGTRNGNQYLGDYTIYVPLSRRFELRIDVPFIDSNKGGANDTYHDRFGDLVVSPRFLLSATRDFSQIFALNVRTATGSQLNGNGVDSVSPHYQFWRVWSGWLGLETDTSDFGKKVLDKRVSVV